jgi:hypothetical protein
MAVTAAPHVMPVTMTMTMTALYEDDAVTVGEHVRFCDWHAEADKIDVVTSAHAARLMKSRRRIGGPPLVGRLFAV